MLTWVQAWRGPLWTPSSSKASTARLSGWRRLLRIGHSPRAFLIVTSIELFRIGTLRLALLASVGEIAFSILSSTTCAWRWMRCIDWSQITFHLSLATTLTGLIVATMFVGLAIVGVVRGQTGSCIAGWIDWRVRIDMRVGHDAQTRVVVCACWKWYYRCNRCTRYGYLRFGVDDSSRCGMD